MSDTPPPGRQAKFTTGSTMRHVVVMTATSSVGLVSVFFVDVLNLFYIALLGQQELAAAIGYSATIMFFTVSLNIGVSIAASALVARALGEGDREKARRMATSAVLYQLGLMLAVSALLYPTLDLWLALLGAKGETLVLARGFMQIVIPSITFLGFGMCFGGLLRAIGDARRAMYVTLSGAVAALIIDPLLIFGLDLGLDGAAWATVCTRLVIAIVGYHGVQIVHGMLGRVGFATVITNSVPFAAIAAPAILTQLATPIGNAWVTQAVAEFGDDAVAGWAIVGRLLPVAFGATFALSGAVGPIMSQNFGAGLHHRVEATLRDALKFILIYCLCAWAVLALGHQAIIALFSATGDAAALVRIFCLVVAGSFLFNGALFVANAAFNNLRAPFLATMFNWGRATLGVVPFVWVGSAWGAEGVLIGWGLGAVLFGIGSVVAAFAHARKLAKAATPPANNDRDGPHLPPSANSPFTSGKGAVSG